MAKRTNSIKNPLIGKETLRVSATTVMRFRQPTNEHTAANVPCFVWDYGDQRQVWPNGDPNALIEATQKTGTRYSTMNRSGHPYALGNIELGGDAEEANGEPLLGKAPPKKMLK
jgi:hypothetical protein